jgi:hypothetical protein
VGLELLEGVAVADAVFESVAAVKGGVDEGDTTADGEDVAVTIWTEPET